jgi:exopolyphosphatase/guanosine-5'-triphosphate,3'-diphosphate pyrophosphatase
MRLAAIDLGTNSFHLVIADTRADGSFHVVESEKEMVRLGETGKDMKSLTVQAMDRGIVALRRFRAIIASRKAHIVKAVATAAVREAENRELFIRRARIEAGIEIEVVSGHEEGRLIYLGALQALPFYNQRVLVLDIGGGSAEYVVGEKGEVRAVNSLKLGAIRLSHQFNLLADPSPADILACRKHIVGELGLCARALRAMGFKACIGTSGTIQAIATIIALGRGIRSNGQPIRMNNFKFTATEVQVVVERLLSAPRIEARLRIAGLDQKRADIILGGALVLQESMRLLGIREMTVSNYALREGVLYDQINTHLKTSAKDVTQLHDIRERSVRQLGDRTNYDRAHADQVTRLSLDLFDQTSRLHHLPIEARNFLYYGALLHDIGYYISHAEHHKHSYYIISNAELLGFTNEEIEIVANIARYHRKSHPKLKHPGFQKLSSDEHREMVRMLSGFLRIADGLDRGHLSLVHRIQATNERGNLVIALKPKSDALRTLELEIWGADRKKQLFEEVFGRQVIFKDLSPRRLAHPNTNGAISSNGKIGLNGVAKTAKALPKANLRKLQIAKPIAKRSAKKVVSKPSAAKVAVRGVRVKR